MTKSDLLPYHDQFSAVPEKLKCQESTQSWITRIFYFPDDENPNGVGIQFSKPGWLNDDGLGIHFETWITEKEIASQKLKFVLHILHRDFFPGTEKKPWDLIWPLVEDQTIVGLVSNWKGFKMGRTHPIKGERKFKDSLADIVAEEFTHFVPIGDRIDTHLKKVLG